MRACTCRWCGPMPGRKKMKQYDDESYYDYLRDGDRWDFCQLCGIKFSVGGQAYGGPGFICTDCAEWESHEESRKYDQDQANRRK